MIRRLDSADPRFERQLDELLARQEPDAGNAAQVAAGLIAEVRREGDAALLRLTRRFDQLTVSRAGDLEVDAASFDAAFTALTAADRQALETAAQRIRRYHERQPSGAFDYADELGNRLSQRATPLDRVGVYVPGGQAAYPSTVLMTAIPAKVAGVGEIIATVPTPNGERNPHVFAAMRLAGVDRAFTVGGAQAVAALAYGTATIPRVDKIVGPGGAYVAAAKRLVFGAVGIDSIAGPSEVLIVADGSVAARWTALDLAAQAEHDAAAQALLLCPDDAHLDDVTAQFKAALPAMPRAEVIRRSMRRHGALVKVRDLEEACRIANRVAPEHLQLALADAEAWLPAIRHAGAIFVGGWAAEALGDYSAGPSHVLPTFGTARYASPLGVTDFQKRSSIIRADAASAAPLARVAADIAKAEGLFAHAEAAKARLGGEEREALRTPQRTADQRLPGSAGVSPA